MRRIWKIRGGVPGGGVGPHFFLESVSKSLTSGNLEFETILTLAGTGLAYRAPALVQISDELATGTPVPTDAVPQ